MHRHLKSLIFVVVLQALFQESRQQKCEKDLDFNENYFDKKDKTLKFEKTLGQGAFGTVYLIKWSGVKMDEDERLVAVKTSNENQRDDDLLKEARVMKKAELKKNPEKELVRDRSKAFLGDWKNQENARNHHENLQEELTRNRSNAVLEREQNQSHIPEFIGCYTGPDDMNYLVFQYIPKPIDPDYSYNLYGIVDGRNKNYLEFVKLPPAQRREIYAQIADGLSQLHDNGITHGDLKPENLLFDTDELSNWTAYIIDFGGAVDTKVRPESFTYPYLDMTFYDHYKLHHQWEKANNQKAKYIYGPQLDVNALAVTMLVLENSYVKD